MVNYQDGKIYQIVNNVNNIKYVGSTTQSLAKRMACHRNDALTRTTKFYIAMRDVGIANFRIVLVKNFPCQSKDELFAEEYKMMKDFQQQGVNLYNDLIGALSEEHKQKITDSMKGKNLQEEHGQFNYGCLRYNTMLSSWRFTWYEDNHTKTKSFSANKYGNYRAKMLAETERKRVYPMWRNEEDLAINELAMIEV